MNRNEDLFSIISPLSNEYDAIEMTNIDQKGGTQRRAVYFFDKRFPRYGNVFLEVWYNFKASQITFVFSKKLLTPSEIAETEKNKRPTANRGQLVRTDMSRGELLSFLRKKLDLYYTQNDLKKKSRETQSAFTKEKNNAMDKFEKLFLKDPAVPSSPVYEIYADAAKKLWDMYSSTYDLRPRSPKKVSSGQNRAVEFYKGDNHIIEVSIGKTTTIYIYDSSIKEKLKLKYNQAPDGRLRYTFDSFTECFDQMKKALKPSNNSNNLFESQILKYGLNIPNNWKGDPRNTFISFFKPLTDDTEYFWEINTRDSSGKLLELHKEGVEKRLMHFKAKQNMTIGIAFSDNFYAFIKQSLDIPENQKAYRAQPHMDLSLATLWNVICVATGKKQYIVQSDTVTLKDNDKVRAVIKKPIKVKNIQSSKYRVVKTIDYEKCIFVVTNTEDGKNYVRKEYKQYNRAIFEKLKDANIPGIPRIIECIEENRTLITIEEFIEGRNLDEVIEQEGFFDDDKMLHIAIAMCDILEKLHKMNPPMIHRDIKPSNIMLKPDGEVVLIDFNASREHREGYTQDTVLLGTKNFASPEQLMGFGDSDARTDIFGLGATLSYIMTGIPINRLVVPGKYSKIFAKCIEMDKKNRYQNVNELRKALLNA